MHHRSPRLPFVRLRTRPRATAGIDALVGMGLLAGAALTILPMMAALTTFALIAAAARGIVRTPRAVRIRSR